MLYVAAKLAHLHHLPQGQPERHRRTKAMVETMEEFFGSCTNHGECETACPKLISIDNIAIMNRDYLRATLADRRMAGRT
jgi:succinate dehydrogenase / fumarate reductase iron-sulfur subunit